MQSVALHASRVSCRLWERKRKKYPVTLGRHALPSCRIHRYAMEKKEEYRYGTIDAENTVCIALLHTTASPGRCADTGIADHMALSGRRGAAAQHIHLQCVMPAPALPDQHLLLGVRHQLRALVRQRRNQCQCSESPPKHHYTDYQLTE